jgi:hypothetical protein
MCPKKEREGEMQAAQHTTKTNRKGDERRQIMLLITRIILDIFGRATS